MSAYFQMGHDTENLVGIAGLEMFSGVVLSPVNRNPGEISRYIPEFRAKGEFDIVLDPQLYCPKSDMGKLPEHPYFPVDIETADISSAKYWANLIKRLASYGHDLGVDAIASPIIFPQRGSDGYFSLCADNYHALSEQLKGTSMRSLLTLCVHLNELEQPADAFRIASIITSARPQCCYLVIEIDLEPRREIQNSSGLAVLMMLIADLERNGCKVLVSHCSSDMVLLKAAGASHASTGKFWNLRRFTRGRFEESDDGGRQIPYWFEHGLMAFIREVDIARLKRAGKVEFIANGDSNNQFAAQTIEQLANHPGKAWIALGWRQYLAWFGATEDRLSGLDSLSEVAGWLKESEKRWVELEDADILFDEARNDGSWIRRWRQALNDFKAAGFDKN